MPQTTITSTQLLLCYDAAAVPDGGSAVYANLTALSVTYSKDPAGHIFHEKALKQAGLLEDPDESDAETTRAPSSAFGSTADFSSLEEDSAKWQGKGKKKKKQRQGNDFYALLGLQFERWMATPEQIRLSYRKTALEHHPDKQKAGADETAMKLAEERFKAVQEAYEVLSDPAKRREYDSIDEFDDSLPNESAGTSSPADFYRVFGAAFRLNARWSVPQPVPDLGDETTPLDKVQAFYQFWYKFKSWREFPHPDEEDVEQAESREHRRYIERWNSKLREKGKKDEMRRIREFVELSESVDPRILAWKNAQKAEREARKVEKEAKRLAEEEEARRKVEEEEARKAAEDAAAVEARKQRQVEKKALQKERSRLRKMTLKEDGSCALPSLDSEDIEQLCANLDLMTIGALNERVANASGVEAQAEALNQHLQDLNASMEEERIRKDNLAKEAAAMAKQAAKKDTKERMAKLQDWTDDEVRLLQKALERFPPGTSKRWETVQGYLRTRTVEEILDMVKHGLKAGKFSNGDAQGVTIAVKRQANTVIKSEATTRLESFSDVEVRLKGEAAAALEGRLKAEAAAAAAAPVLTEAWSEADDVALVKALKEVPKDAADRWDQVAAAVGSKNKAQCAKRFKEMKEKFKAKKSGS